MKTESKPQFEPNHLLARPSPFRFLPLFILSALLLNLFFSCNNSQKISESNKNKPYVYVQIIEGELEGKIVKAKPVDPLHREEGAIANFAENWLKIAFTWQKTGGQSPNYVKERGTNYPYSFYLASLGMKPGAREAFMNATKKKYRKKFLFSQYISGQFQSYVRIFEHPIVSPVKNEDGGILNGVWDVKIVSTRTHAEGKSILGYEVFNRVIRLRAVKPTDELGWWGDGQTNLGKLLNQMQMQGLQVVSVTEF